MIWHDANLQIIHNEIIKLLILLIIKKYAFFKHPDRICVYEEAIKCIQLEKDYPFKILYQIYGYYINGMKPETGLYDTSIVVKNSKLIRKEFLFFWWDEIKNKSRRDQLSLPYSLKKYRMNTGGN